MPTDLGSEFSPLWRGRYPNMLPEDVPIWDKFLDLNANLFKRIFYNVRVGGVVTTDQAQDRKMADMYFKVTAKRIDALCELEKELWLVEVAARPGLRAVGQLTSYVYLWNEDPKINKPLYGVLVGQDIDADLQKVLTFNGMRFRLST